MSGDYEKIKTADLPADSVGRKIDDRVNFAETYAPEYVAQLDKDINKNLAHLQLSVPAESGAIELRDRLTELDGYETPVGGVSLEKADDGRALDVFCKGEKIGSVYVTNDHEEVPEYHCDVNLGGNGTLNGGHTIEELKTRLDYLGLSMGLRQELLPVSKQLANNYNDSTDAEGTFYGDASFPKNSPLFYKGKVYFSPLDFTLSEPVSVISKATKDDTHTNRMSPFGGRFGTISASDKAPYYTVTVRKLDLDGSETFPVALETNDPKEVKQYIDRTLESGKY